MKSKIASLLILLLVLLTSCKKKAICVFEEAHFSLKNIVDLAAKLDSKENIYENFDKMKGYIIKYNKVLIDITSRSYNELDGIAKKHADVVKRWSEYQSLVFDNRRHSFISDMKRIGALSLEGQKLRNAFYEVTYQHKKRMKKLYKQANLN